MPLCTDGANTYLHYRYLPTNKSRLKFYAGTNSVPTDQPATNKETNAQQWNRRHRQKRNKGGCEPS